MKFTLFGYVIATVFICAFVPNVCKAQSGSSAYISGRLALDQSWDTVIYLSRIPTFDDMYVMSGDMILAKTDIDNLGNFLFDVDFLPEEESLYRLHLVKKEDTPATLIIGGKDENHHFFIASGSSTIELNSKSGQPPFKNISYQNSPANKEFQLVTQLVNRADSVAAKSTAAKRSLIEAQLLTDLLNIADTSSHFLVALHAIYKSKFESNYESNRDEYEAFIERWKKQDNAYFNSFAKQIPSSDNSRIPIVGGIISLLLAAVGFFFFKRRSKGSKGFENLSVQERKIFQFLQEGASNKEISEHFNIEMSTVKTHVSSIYAKLNVRSRKDIVNMK
ncbi:MAG: helix-turn-helix transcriptional regulator [Cryomorphaceae bacterium]